MPSRLHTALLGAAALPLLLGGCYNRAAEVAELARHHATAAGRIVALVCQHAGRWWFQFEWDGQHRRGWASDGADGAACARRRLGDSVTVYVNPAVPAVHRAIDPGLAYEQERGFYLPQWLWFGLGALALPLSAWMALKRGSRR